MRSVPGLYLTKYKYFSYCHYLCLQIFNTYTSLNNLVVERGAGEGEFSSPGVVWVAGDPSILLMAQHREDPLNVPGPAQV